MFFNHYRSTRPLVALAAVVLGIGLLAGCSEQPAAGSNAGNSARAPGNAEAASEQREVVFSVPGMNCPMCPITIKRALNDVDGVSDAWADLETKKAHAVFDPSQTSIDALITAIENAGYSVKETHHE